MNPNTPDCTSLTLLAQARDNEPEAWTKIVRLYGPLIYSWARDSRLQAADVADVVQEVFQVVQKKLSTFETDRKPVGGFRSWLWGITRLKLLDHFRSIHKDRLRTGHLEEFEDVYRRLDDQHLEPETIDGQQPQALLIASAVRIVKAESESNTWDAFWRMAVVGQRASEIAIDLGMTSRAVRQAKFRVTRKLRLLLNDDLGGLEDTGGEEDSGAASIID